MKAKCEIGWVDHNGAPTYDSNDAVCVAVSTIESGPQGAESANVRRYGCCEAHAKQLDQLVAKGADRVFDGDRYLYTSRWTREG